MSGATSRPWNELFLEEVLPLLLGGGILVFVVWLIAFHVPNRPSVPPAEPKASQVGQAGGVNPTEHPRGGQLPGAPTALPDPSLRHRTHVLLPTPLNSDGDLPVIEAIEAAGDTKLQRDLAAIRQAEVFRELPPDVARALRAQAWAEYRARRNNRR